MDSLFGKHIASHIVAFSVGSERKEIMVHSGPLADLSPALSALLNGAMREAKLKQVDWSHISEDTFARLCQFAYMGDYSPPLPKEGAYVSPMSIKLEPDPAPKPPFDQRGFPFGRPASNVGTWMGKTPQPVNNASATRMLPPAGHFIQEKHLKTTFSDCSFPPPQSSHDLSPKCNTSPSQDFGPVLCGHAELYILADTYGVEPLRQLVLSKIYGTLQVFTVHETDVGTLVDFVKFCYANTLSHPKERDPLRNLATRYMVSILRQVGEHERFLEMLVEGGDFVTDLWSVVWNH
ncbi:hypothetical protein ABOM_000720 [Aspergillus bombycis]|uniref:BTB domain-containing protein n=1 Tax=Aspergillus bombycis TaxID=109264 RepID=A0A1F8AGF3_9EURO|nr:hypothetical protein ABOM_000720 [Aspergillus bombycis]OGM50757.1 hypothetical protein ABOM_000720 [Aspergillus bombycis]